MALVRSLRFRITCLAMVAVVIVLCVVGVIVVRAVDSHLLGQVDHGLVNSGNYLGARIAHNEFVPVTVPADQLGQGLSPSGHLLGESANPRDATTDRDSAQ